MLRARLCSLFVAVLVLPCVAAAHDFRSTVVALLPAEATEVEATDVATLRTLSNFRELREREDERSRVVQAILRAHGIPTEAIRDILVGSLPNRYSFPYFGFVEPSTPAFSSTALNGPGKDTHVCLLSIGPYIAFGSPDVLREIQTAATVHLAADAFASHARSFLLNTDSRAQVRGITRNASHWIAECMREVAGVSIPASLLNQLDVVDEIRYSIDFRQGTNARLVFVCKSPTYAGAVGVLLEGVSRFTGTLGLRTFESEVVGMEVHCDLRV